MTSWPNPNVLVRLSWLRALVSVSEGATTSAAAYEQSPCVAAVLGDAQKRLCALGARDSMPRSLGSVLGSFVTRFLGAEDTWENAMAVLREQLDDQPALAGLGYLLERAERIVSVQSCALMSWSLQSHLLFVWAVRTGSASGAAGYERASPSISRF